MGIPAGSTDVASGRSQAKPLRQGVYVSCFGPFADAVRAVELAAAAEAAGWDGFFLWDHVHRAGLDAGPDASAVDPWIALAGAAVHTERIRLGPLVTPLARRRPWKLAREVASLDRLSRGRLVLGVGLGAAGDFEPFGEDAGARLRAAKLDEGLELLVRLLSGEPLDHRGRHYRVQVEGFTPRTVQRPRPPIWVAGIWPNPRPFRRAARFEGAFPLGRDTVALEPGTLRAIAACIRRERAPGAAPGFDLVASGASSGLPEDAGPTRARLAALAAAGATWWLEWLDGQRGGADELLARVLRGPVR